MSVVKGSRHAAFVPNRRCDEMGEHSIVDGATQSWKTSLSR